MHTRDRVRLDADAYIPDAPGDFPVLLMRQPYGRAIASTVVYAHPAWYAAHGYIVVIQDVRGRGSSEGEFRLFAHEQEDGFDAIEWAARLPNSTGQVGMYGFSYQGMTQLYAAAAHPPALKTICPSMVGYDLYHDWAYEGGAFCYQLNLGWAIQLSAETARRRGDRDAYQTLYQAARNLPLDDPVWGRSPLLETLDPDSFYHDWLAHPERDDYWQHLSPRRSLATVDLPMLHIGGWFDTYLRGTLRLYQEMVSRSAFAQHLIVGAWTHLPWGRRVGAVDFGEAAISPIDRMQVQWFDRFLKGVEIPPSPPVQLFELGSNQWLTAEQFPQSQVLPYFLSSTGLASVRGDDGELCASPQTASIDRLVHDPWRPVPAMGGHATQPAGCFDRAAVDERFDVLTYTSTPLTQPLHLLGDSVVTLYCTVDASTIDCCAVLSFVKPNGQAYHLCQGYQRSALDASGLLHISLQPVCAKIAQGDRLRLSLSAACFPAYTVNSGTSLSARDSQLLTARIITIEVDCGGDRASHVRLRIRRSS
jgi:hypothetical protein